MIHPNPTRLSAEELLLFCADQAVTVVNFTVALWQQWVDNLALQGPAPFPAHCAFFSPAVINLPADIAHLGHLGLLSDALLLLLWPDRGVDHHDLFPHHYQ